MLILAMLIGMNVQGVPMLILIMRVLTHLLEAVIHGAGVEYGIGAVTAVLTTAPGHFVDSALMLVC